MTIAARPCTCGPSIFPSLGRPCPVHGSDSTRRELDMLRAANARLVRITQKLSPEHLGRIIAEIDAEEAEE